MSLLRPREGAGPRWARRPRTSFLTLRQSPGSGRTLPLPQSEPLSCAFHLPESASPGDRARACRQESAHGLTCTPSSTVTHGAPPRVTVDTPHVGALTGAHGGLLGIGSEPVADTYVGGDCLTRLRCGKTREPGRLSTWAHSSTGLLPVSSVICGSLTLGVDLGTERWHFVHMGAGRPWVTALPPTS